MKLQQALLSRVLLCAAAGAADAQVFDPAKVGPPQSNQPAELYLPRGAAPTAAVVGLPGCDRCCPTLIASGRGALRTWGYAALLIDCYRPRWHRSLQSRPRGASVDRPSRRSDFIQLEIFAADRSASDQATAAATLRLFHRTAGCEYQHSQGRFDRSICGNDHKETGLFHFRRLPRSSECGSRPALSCWQ